MCIYCNTTNYRKIYENHFGPIPKDLDGRTYEIHHIDGNRKNNAPDNLKCVTIQEHYDIHYAQGDYGACFKIALVMKLSPEKISELAREREIIKLENGSHIFLNKDFRQQHNKRRVDSGTHNLLGDGTFQRNIQMNRINKGVHPFQKRPDGTSLQTDRVNNGTHNFLKPVDSSHPTQFKWTCPHCGKSGKSKSMFNRWHGKNCKSLY